MTNQSEGPQGSEEARTKEVEVVKSAEEAVRLVQLEGVVGIYKDTYMDEVRPNYIVFHDKDKLSRFEELLGKAKKTSEGNSDIMKILDELEKIAGIRLETSMLDWIYRNGEWAIPPEGLIEDEESWKMQEEDWDWFDAQREHFAGMEEDQGGYALERQSQRMQEAEESYDDEEDKDDEYPFDEEDENADWMK